MMSAALNDQIVYERPDVPDAVKNRPPTAIRCAIEKFGLPDAWQECRWEKKGLSKDASDFRYLEIEGAVYPHRKKKIAGLVRQRKRRAG
jgi:hypothetical protein